MEYLPVDVLQYIQLFCADAFLPRQPKSIFDAVVIAPASPTSPSSKPSTVITPDPSSPLAPPSPTKHLRQFKEAKHVDVLPLSMSTIPLVCRRWHAAYCGNEALWVMIRARLSSMASHMKDFFALIDLPQTSAASWMVSSLEKEVGIDHVAHRLHCVCRDAVSLSSCGDLLHFATDRTTAAPKAKFFLHKLLRSIVEPALCLFHTSRADVVTSGEDTGILISCKVELLFDAFTVFLEQLLLDFGNGVDDQLSRLQHAGDVFKLILEDAQQMNSMLVDALRGVASSLSELLEEHFTTVSHSDNDVDRVVKELDTIKTMAAPTENPCWDPTAVLPNVVEVFSKEQQRLEEKLQPASSSQRHAGSRPRTFRNLSNNKQTQSPVRGRVRGALQESLTRVRETATKATALQEKMRGYAKRLTNSDRLVGAVDEIRCLCQADISGLKASQRRKCLHAVLAAVNLTLMADESGSLATTNWDQVCQKVVDLYSSCFPANPSNTAPDVTSVLQHKLRTVLAQRAPASHKDAMQQIDVFRQQDSSALSMGLRADVQWFVLAHHSYLRDRWTRTFFTRKASTSTPTGGNGDVSAEGLFLMRVVSALWAATSDASSLPSDNPRHAQRLMRKIPRCVHCSSTATAEALSEWLDTWKNEVAENTTDNLSMFLLELQSITVVAHPPNNNIIRRDLDATSSSPMQGFLLLDRASQHHFDQLLCIFAQSTGNLLDDTDAIVDTCDEIVSRCIEALCTSSSDNQSLTIT